ncbi:MAG: hypothetical protein LBJ19_02410 [Holosporaceae bacterium]|jgi:cell shape-determining protein MreD|nr:hypothetical protein [Holosporaceae bacterium]
MRIVSPILIALLFLQIAFISANLSVAALYVFIFMRMLTKPLRQGIAVIFLTSLLMDIYMLLEIGVSFLRFSIFYLLIRHFHPVLLRMQAVLVAYYFLLLVCVTELTHHWIAFICCGVFDLLQCVYQIVLTVILGVISGAIMYIVEKFKGRFNA